MLKKLFEPIQINGLTLKNRMMVSAMVTQYCGEDGLPTEKWIQYMEHKARGGWGLVFTENYGVTKTANSFKRQAGLWEDGQIPAHTELVRRVHTAGGTIGCQIYHSGRQNTTRVAGVRPVGPSAIREPSMKEVPHELTTAEVKELVEAFGDCALRAKQCGFDIVEIHGGHGYLINEFVSAFSNKRSDEYGGTFENRCRFALEIVRNVREKVGADFPISFRLSTNDYVEGGTTLVEAQALAQLLEEAGVDLIHCTQGMYVSKHTLIPPSSVPKGAFVDNAAAIKAVVNIPVVATGRINDPVQAEAILRSGKADMVTMARASLADPDMPNKAKEGKLEDIIYCIGCCQGCTGENARGNQIRCLMNPLTGMEDEYDLSPAESKKKVVIAGGGIAGCEAAIVAAMRGHQVTVLEQSDRLGGQWLMASVPPGKSEFTNLVVWQERMMKKLGVDVRYGTTATKGLLDSLCPDVVIDAIGSVPAMPPVPGLKEHSVTARQILSVEGAEVGHKVVVIGGGLVGAETADYLAVQGHDVTVIEMMPKIMSDGEASPTKLLLERFHKLGVQVLTSAKVQKVLESAVTYVQNGQEGCVEQVDTIINAMGRKANHTLAEALTDAGYPVISVGDAKEAKSGYLGIREGYEAGLSI